MKYVEKETNKVIWLHKIRLANPNMSIPDNADLTDLGYIKVEDTEMPVQEGFYAVEVDPIDYKQTWELREVIITEEQKKNEALNYLKETDWVEIYKLKHDLGAEVIPEESSKWDVINKREEFKIFLKSL